MPPKALRPIKPEPPTEKVAEKPVEKAAPKKRRKRGPGKKGQAGTKGTGKPLGRPPRAASPQANAIRERLSLLTQLRDAQIDAETQRITAEAAPAIALLEAELERQ